MQIPSDLQYIQLNSYYKTNKVKVSAFQLLISFKLRQLWDKFLQYITFLFHFSISSFSFSGSEPKKQLSEGWLSLPIAKHMLKWSQGLEIPPAFASNLLSQGKVKIMPLPPNSSQISQFFRGQYYIHWFLSQNPVNHLGLNNNLSWTTLKHSVSHSSMSKTSFCLYSGKCRVYSWEI